MRATADVASILAGDPVHWAALQTTPTEFVRACAREDVSALVHARIRTHSCDREWPVEIRDTLAGLARAETAREMVRCAEVTRAIDALTAAGVRPVLFKGAALAYTVYQTPAERPRLDTDILIDAADRDVARHVLEGLGYAAPPYCDDLLSQLQMEKTDAFGLPHVIDVHWKISTQRVFEDVLAHGEMLGRAMRVPALGAAAVAASFADALLLSCIHPAMHHRNVERILWIYDTHLVAARLTPADFSDLARHAGRTRVAAVCAHQLGLARAMFGTHVPEAAMTQLANAVDEPSADYLASERKWRHELASTMRALPRAADRATLVRRVLLPGADYMLAAYGLRDKPLAPCLLPALYVHRGVRGAWRILAGKK